MKSLRETLENIRKNKPNIIHKLGDWYYHTENEEYALLSAISGKVCLVLFDGFFWDTPIEVKDINNITKEEWESISSGEWEFVCESQA